MKQTLVIDFTRTFVDARPALYARTSKDAIAKLHANEGKIGAIWMDNNLGPADSTKAILDYLSLRSKIGSKYPVNVIFVHAPDEAGWQILEAKLKANGYRVQRGTIRDTLG